jgi:hypothetical protein
LGAVELSYVLGPRRDQLLQIGLVIYVPAARGIVRPYIAGVNEPWAGEPKTGLKTQKLQIRAVCTPSPFPCNWNYETSTCGQEEEEEEKRERKEEKKEEQQQ